MMLWRGFRGICMFSLAVSSGNALTIPTEGTLDNTPASLINIPVLSSPGPSSNLTDVQIDCQGSRYGRGLRYSSCLDAFRTFQQGATENPVMIRRRGPGQAARKLPWMWVSDDGTCTFNVVMRGRASSEITSGTEIARAAWKVMNECVRDQGGQGGIVSGLGQRGTLGIIIRPYDPVNIECGRRPQTYDTSKCDALLNEIPADTGPEKTFGPPHQAGVDVPMPHEWRVAAPYDKCRIIFAGINSRVYDHMTYYDAWHASVVLAAMCVRNGDSGLFNNLGTQGRIVVVIDDGSQPLEMSDRIAFPTNAGRARSTMTLDGEWDSGWNGSMAVP